MPSRLPALLAMTVLPLAGCFAGGPAVDQPLVVISGPRAFSRFELRDADQSLLWSLVADEPAPVSALVYGVVPAGFRQQSPPDGARPRSLVAGEPLALESVTAVHVFRHQGFADTGQRLAINSWGMTLRNPPAPAELDAAPREP